MLLIHPPIAKPSEPPAGIAKLSGALRAHTVPHQILDANIEGMLHLAAHAETGNDTWTRRARKNLDNNVSALRSPRLYDSFDSYCRAVRDLNRVLSVSARSLNTVPGLADYSHQHLSPVRSADLIAAAECPEQNPFYPYFKRRLAEIITEKKTGMPVVGFSLNYQSQALCTFSMIGHIRKEFPELRIVLGGGLVSSWVKQPTWKNPFAGLVDHLIAGPGERPMLGLAGITNGTHEHYLPNYQSMPLHDYLSPGLVLPYSGSNGCYWHQCSFCPETAENNPYTPIPVRQTRTDLSCLIGETKPVLVHLLDNAINPALMRSLADDPAGAPWYGFARINSELADPDYCLQLKQSGCVMLKLGLESGDQGVLDALGKGIDLSAASRVLRNLRKAGIASYVYLLFGTPPETMQEARRTLDFIAAHHDAISFLNLAIFNMPLCRQGAGEFQAKQFYEGDLSLYTDFKHPRGWDRMLVRHFLDDEFRRHPAVKPILKNNPPFFTSNHAAFFA